jgi:hypothetical protein
MYEYTAQTSILELPQLEIDFALRDFIIPIPQWRSTVGRRRILNEAQERFTAGNPGSISFILVHLAGRWQKSEHQQRKETDNFHGQNCLSQIYAIPYYFRREFTLMKCEDGI